MTNLRFNVVEEAFKKKPLEVVTPMERPSEYFGKNVFNRAKMYKYLPPSVYETLIDVIDNGATLDRSIADAVAAGMKQWAEENGVTHYTHWFQPLTEGTAEKHDLGQAARTAGTRRKLVPKRRNTQHVRGARLLRMGPYVAGIHHGRHALHTHHFYLLHWRSVGLQSPAAARAARSERGRH